MSSVNSFGSRDTLKVGDESYEIYRLDAVARWLDAADARIKRLPAAPAMPSSPMRTRPRVRRNVGARR